jgi:phospholipase/lecithinase/hemolysin
VGRLADVVLAKLTHEVCRMKLRPAVAIVCGLVVAATFHVAAVHAAPINGLVIFGDSLSDPGNNAIALGSTASPPLNVTQQSDITSNAFIPTYPYATSLQYSNGSVWAYQFATLLGLQSQVAGPVLGGGAGANYAYGGATTGPLNNSGFPPSLLTQTAAFISSLGAASAPAGALYVVAGGGNNARDALTAIAGGADPTATITATSLQFAADIGDIVDTLQGKGAVNIAVWDVPNVGLAPAIAANGSSAAQLGTTVSQAMNNALGNRLASETGVQIFGIYSLVTAVNANPAAYGLTNASDASGAISGADPSQYLYWDGIHPTAAGHAILAQSMYAAVVPEPSSCLLVLAGLTPAVVAVRLRRSAASAPMMS